MKFLLIEQKPWYNKYLQIYQNILTISEKPDDLSKFINTDENVKISDFSVNSNTCNNCFNYFSFFWPGHPKSSSRHALSVN